jgi:hypothetical protein
MRTMKKVTSIAGVTPDEEAELRWLEEELLRRIEADFIKGQARAVQALAAGTISYKDVALAAAEESNLRAAPRPDRQTRGPARCQVDQSASARGVAAREAPAEAKAA